MLPESPEQKAAQEAQRFFIAAQTRNEQRIWAVLGPVMLIGAITIFLLWQHADLPTSGLVILLVGSLGILYTGLLMRWRGPIPTWLAFVLVTLEGCLAPVILWSDAAFDLTLARESSAAAIAFVAVAVAGLRYRPWLVVYAGLLGAGLTALLFPVLCPTGTSDVIFCHPGLYWWRPVFILLVAAAGALTVQAALKTFSVTERTLFEKEETDRLAKAKQMFLASVTHELRTPLNSILVLSKLLRDSEEQSQKGREQAQVIHNAGSSLLALINDILDLSKIEAGAMVLVPERVDVDAFADELDALFQPIAKEKSLDFSVHKSAEVPPQIQVDRLRLDQILRNLVGNALKFTKTGKVSVVIHPVDADCLARLLNETRAEEIAENRDDYVAFSVRDTGLGISVDVQEKIFSAFVQADDTTSQRFGGTGLGLSICAHLTQLMDGELGVESGPGQGSTFTLILPIRLASPPDAALDATEQVLTDDKSLAPDDNLSEVTDPGNAATTRLRNEVLRSVALPSETSTANMPTEMSTGEGQLWTEISALTSPAEAETRYQDCVAAILHEDVLTNYRVASALESLGLQVISRTSETEIPGFGDQEQKPELLLVSPKFAHLATTVAVPTFLIEASDSPPLPLPPGICGQLTTPVQTEALDPLLRKHLGGTSI